MSRPGAALPSIAASLEGGSHGTSIARARAAGASARWDWWASVSRERTGGRVENEDHQVGRLSLGFGAAPAAGQQLHVAFHYNDAESGFPGPYGTDPIGAFSGIDEVSRGDFRDLVLGADYDLELRPSFRLRLSGGAVGADGEFSSSFGDSFSEQRRGLLRAEGEWKLSERHRLAFGAELARESVRSTFITDDSFQPFRLERGQNGYFIEERFSAGRRLSVTAGLRVEDISTGPVPAALVFGRPAFPERSERSVNPKVAASLGLGSGVRLHGSAGTGIRPPDGFEIAFTNNPALEPEQTRSFDAGAELRLASGRLSLDATWFENRYDNLIVVLGRGASGLSRYSSDNLDNARSRGLELSWSASPLRGLILSGSYTYLATEILALDGDRAGALRSPFRVGQSLTRRPGHTLFQSVTWTRGGLTAQGSVLARSKTLDVEPNFGTFGGFFDNPGYARVDLAGSYRLWGPLAACARVENLLDRDYEDVLGYPALPFTASAGIRVDWRR
jgi:outer membrane receptor protein involved in Fe transport